MTTGTPYGPTTCAARFVSVRVAGVRYAFPLESVLEVHQAAAVTPAPEGPDRVLGWLDLRGTVMPVVDAREALGLERVAWDPGMHFVIVAHEDRTAAVVVDELDDVMDGMLEPGASEGSPGIAGVARSADGLVPVLDPAVLVPSGAGVTS
jgi:purine-binding chemotaxis protein CheW